MYLVRQKMERLVFGVSMGRKVIEMTILFENMSSMSRPTA